MKTAEEWAREWLSDPVVTEFQEDLAKLIGEAQREAAEDMRRRCVTAFMATTLIGTDADAVSLLNAVNNAPLPGDAK